MAAKNQPDTSSNTPASIVSRNDLTEEQLADITDLIAQNYKPSEIAREFPGVPLRLIENLKRDYRRSPSTGAPLPNTVAPSTGVATPVDPTYLQHKRFDARQRWLDQRQQMLDQRQQLIDQRQQMVDIQREKLELEDEFSAGGDEPAEGEDGDAPEPDELLDQYDFEANPFGALAKFITAIRQKQDTPSPPATPPPPDTVIDVTQPLTSEQIRAEISAKAKPGELEKLKWAVDNGLEGKVVEGIKQQYPGITEENIKLCLQEIRHYVR